MYEFKTNIFKRIPEIWINYHNAERHNPQCPLFQLVQYSNMAATIPFGPGGPGSPMPGIPGSPFAPGMPDNPRWPGWPGSPVKRRKSTELSRASQNKKLLELHGYLAAALPGRPGSPFLPGGPGGPGTPGSVIVWPGSPFGPEAEKRKYVSVKGSLFSVILWRERKVASHIPSLQGT